MFSLSTSWNSARHDDGFGLIEEIKAIGFDTVELSFALSEKMAGDILSLVKDSAIKVSSLHNMCPLPKEIERDEASPDYYSLASPDQEERELAVSVAKNTIDYAAELGARAVVLHAGRVQIKDGTRDLAALFGEEARFRAFREEMVRERQSKKDGYLDNVIKSLGELVPYAKKVGISLGIENRYYYREIPLEDEMQILFDNFKEGEIFYWHDIGHAEVFDRLGLANHRKVLEKFSGRLLGVHLHDIMGIMNDHKPPGLGTLDFNIIKPYLTKDTIKVLEVHHPATADQVARSAEHLAKILG